MTNLDTLAATLLAALGVASIKGAVVLAVASLAAIGLRSRSASLKHLLWTVALAATVAMLILPSVIPAWRVMPFPATSSNVTTTANGANTLLSSRLTIDGQVDRFTPSQSAAATPRMSPTTIAINHWALITCAIWFIAAIAVLATYVRSTAALHRLTRRAQTLDGRHGVHARNLAARLGLKRTVTFHVSDEVDLPLTWGIIRPRVLLPDDVAEWSATRIEYVLQHELAHVRRMDAATQIIAYAASALFWFNPLVWHAAAQMRRERERACDDDVLAQGAVASDYADDLLAFVRAQGHVERHVAALAMARRSQFEGRLLALLDSSLDRGPVSIRGTVATIAVAMSIVVPMAALNGAIIVPPSTVAASPSTVAASPTPVVVSTPPVIPPAPVAVRRRRQSAKPVELFDGCLADGSSGIHSHPVNGQTLLTADASDAACSYKMVAHGDVTFNDDATGFANISTDGDIDVTTVVRDAVTHLHARPNTTGGIGYDFAVNGAAADFNTLGKPWLAAFLVALDRQTAFAVDKRLPLLLKKGGASLVMDEIDRIRTDHAKMVYLTTLPTATVVDSVSTGRIIVAIASMRTDHSKVEALVVLARTQKLSYDNRRDITALAAKFDGDYDRQRVLAALSHS